MSQRPLSHIRILDLGHYLAGPLVGMLLADLGAELIRIDPPGGPRWTDPAFDMLSRGKRALTLDLKSIEGLAQARTLVARADIVIENFRPGVMARLGLGPEALRRVNPGIISLSLPGFASADPELRDIAAWEAAIVARTGQFTDMGLNRQLMGVNPSFTPLGLASAYGAAFGAMSVLFALGQGGEHIEVPLASALFEGLVYNATQVEDYPERYKSPREVELDKRRSAGLPLDLSYEELGAFLDPFYRTYRCADGRGFYVVACSIVTHPARVLTVLGLEGLAATLPDFDAYLDQADWPATWAMRNYPVGTQDRARVSLAMEQAFLTKTSREWEVLFGAAKAPGTAQQVAQEWLADPHAQASGLVLSVDDPRYGRMQQIGNLAWIAQDAGALEKAPGPQPDDLQDDLAKILAEPPRAEHANNRQTGWLDGLRVLDLTNVIAGPTVGSTLARFGAQVTSVQPVSPSVDPWNAIVFGLQAHRGKRSALLNLGTPDGRAAMHRLIAQSDVVTFNGTDEQRDALGLAPEALAALNPRGILVQLDAWGGPRRGPKSDHLGYDDLAQAATGVMVRFGGGPDTPEEHAHFGTIDALTGHVACIALGAALEQRRRTGKGSVARAALAGCGAMIQAQFMYDFEGRAPFDEPSGREAGPFYRCYEAADSWFFFAAPTVGQQALAQVAELADLANLAEEALIAALAMRFRAHPLSFWSERLNIRSSAVVPPGSLAENRTVHLQHESEGNIDIRKSTYRAIRHDAHPMGRWVDLVAPNAIRPDQAAITIPAAAPKPGRDTHSVLASVGYIEAEIAAMIAAGMAG